MGRFKIYDPKQMVRILEDPKYAVCLQCEKKLKNVMGNIKRHYEQIHDIVLNANGTKEERKSSKNYYDDNDYKPSKAFSKKRKEEPAPANCIKHKECKLKVETKETQTDAMNSEQQQQDVHTYINNIQIEALDSGHEEEFLKCFIETKSLLNISLSKFQEALQSTKQNFNLKYNLQTIGEHIDQMATRLRQDISRIVGNRLIHLKLDTASEKDSNIMLINIQFIKDFELKVYTLSALELPNDMLTINLEKKLETALESYKIDVSQVYSITKDNISVGKSLNLGQKDTTYAQPHSSEYCQNLCEQFPGHTLHFVACDIIQQLNENISQSRDSVKTIRRQMLSLSLKSLPELDNTTSWCSIYDMIKSLLNIRQLIENNSNITVEVDWTFILKFEASFRPIVHTAQMLLQSDNHFVMGDFYREWLICELELEELAFSNELALYLLESLRKHKKDLYENDTFLAALYLDPRFCHAATIHFTNEQKNKAITQLLQIFNRLKTVPNNESDSNSSTKSTDRYAKLEKNMLVKMEITTFYPPASLNTMDCKWLKESLEQLQFQERLPFNANILDYWKMVKYKNPILAVIAEIALAAPATQVTINRALNAWRPLTSMKRNKNLSSANIENILLLKLNQDLVDKISLET